MTTKIDTTRTIYFAMDSNTGGKGGDSKDIKFHDNIISKLKNAGFKVVDMGIGPNQTGYTYNYVRIHQKKHSILLVGGNGVDTTNIREATSTGTKGDSKWTYASLKPLDNEVVIFWWKTAIDCVHEWGRGYKAVCTKNSGLGGCGGRMDYPMNIMKANGVKAICVSDDGGYNPKQRDDSGDTLVKEFLAFYTIGDSPDSPTTPTTPDTSTTDTTDSTTNTKKLQTKIIEKTYTHPYYNTNTGIITTDNNGAFNKKIILPYNGKYKINYHYSGSQNYAPTNKTIYLEYHAGQYFITKLLKTKITETDTDNKTTITETGTIPKEEHTKTEITTITYKNGVETGRTTTTRIDDEYNNTFKNPDNNPTTPTTPNTPITPITPTTPETPIVNDTGKETILTKTITPKNNKPDITTLGSDYKEADPNGTYTITSREILRTQTLDSLCQQLYGYVPKYTFFRAYGSNTKYIIERKKWNVIVRALNKYHVSKNFNSTNPPYALKISLKDKIRYQPIYYDRQDTGYTCGPTSMSMISQALNFYRSEKYLFNTFKTTTSDGTNESSIIKYAPNVNMKVINIPNTKNDVKTALKSGAGILWHISGHYMCICGYNEDKDLFLALNPSGLHNINRYSWITWSNIMNADRPLKDNGFMKVIPNWTFNNEIVSKKGVIPRIDDIQITKTHIKNYYLNCCEKYITPANTEDVSTIDSCIYYLNESDIPNTTPIPSPTPTPSITPDNDAQNPFKTKIPLITENGVTKPNLSKWKVQGYTFKWADENGTYTIPKKYYREVMERDAKTMQLTVHTTDKMSMSKYVIFSCGQKDTNENLIYYVIRREKWNTIEKAINYVLVYGAGSDDYKYKEYMEQITINLGGKNNWAGTTINLKGKEYNYWFVVDQQGDTSTEGGSCGPTSASMITQYFHNFSSEWQISKKVGNARGISEYNNYLTSLNLNSSERLGSKGIVRELKKGKPIFIHTPNHYSMLADISDDGSKILVFNPSRNYSISAGWQKTSYVQGRLSAGGHAYSPNLSISESEKTQLLNLLENLGGVWNRKLDYSDWQKSGSSNKIWDKYV